MKKIEGRKNLYIHDGELFTHCNDVFLRVESWRLSGEILHQYEVINVDETRIYCECGNDTFQVDLSEPYAVNVICAKCGRKGNAYN